MKIVFFDFVIHFGGGPQLAADTAVRLSKTNQVYVFDAYGACPDFLNYLKKGNNIEVKTLVPEAKNVYIGYRNNKLIRYLRIIYQMPILIKLRQRLLKNIQQIRPDVIWTNNRLGFFFLGISLRLLKYPIVMEIIGCPDASTYKGIGFYLMKKRVDTIMAISTETAKQLELASIDPAKIAIVFDTIDFDLTIAKSNQQIKSLPSQELKPAILLPANLIPKKGQPTAIKAIAELKKAGLEPVLWIAGDVVGNDYSYQEYLEKLIKELGLEKNVHLLGWRGDVPAIMKKADVVILPTHEEGFGHVILEAMLLKVPVIATAVGGIKDSIENNVNGILIKVDDYKALADGINKIVGEPLFAKKLVENAYQTVTQRFAPENHTKLFIEAVEKAIKIRKNIQ